MDLGKRRRIAGFMAALSIVALGAGPALGHPGGLDGNGGHHCWTNCDSWGETYGAWHCHRGCNGGGGGGGSTTPPPDTRPPAKPEVRKTAVKGNRLRIIFSAERNAKVNFWLRGTLKKAVTATGSKQTVDLTLADGRHTIKIVAKDAAGNKSKPRYVERTIDTRAPNDPWITIDSVDGSSESSFTIGGEPDARYQFRIVQGSTQVVSRSGRLPNAGRTSLSAALPDGSYTATVFVTDDAGNRSRTTSEPFDVTTPAPSSAPAPEVTATEFQPISAPADDGEGGDGSALTGAVVLAGLAVLFRKRLGRLVRRTQ